MRGSGVILSFIVLSSLAFGQASLTGPIAPTGAPATRPVIVIGFVGGYIRHDNSIHGGVQLASHLRKDYPSDVDVQVFENHRGEEAHQEILRLLDTDRNGTLSAEEKKNARIIIYGHSWGASEAITLARKLERDGIPVLLTIQVDSVRKHGEDDSLIPANVAQAANFYQSNGLLHGQRAIRAADPARTQILGNFRFDYDANPIHCNGYPWYARVFENPHIEIECDPSILKHVESLIRAKLPSTTRDDSEGH